MEKLAWMLQTLAEYPGAQEAIGYPPDAAIARDCLELAGWDLAVIRSAFTATYQRGAAGGPSPGNRGRGSGRW